GNAWSVPIEQATTTVSLPSGAEPFATCFAGITNEECRSSTSGTRATFTATRTLFPGEELTVVVGWQKGIVAVQEPVLEDRTSVDDFFTFDWIELGGAAAFLAFGLAALGRAWWSFC